MYGDAQSRGLTQRTFQGRRPPSRLMPYRFTPCMQGTIRLSSSPESSRHAVVLNYSLRTPTQAHVLVTLLRAAPRAPTLSSQTTEIQNVCSTRATICPVPKCFTLSSRRSLHALSLRAARSARAYIARRAPSCPTSWPSSSCPSGCSDCEQRTGDASEGRGQ